MHIFLTNHTFFETRSDDRKKESPILLKHATNIAHSINELTSNFVDAIDSQAKVREFSKEEIFQVWKRLELKQGPSLNDFEDSIAHTHLPQVNGCVDLKAFELNRLRDELIAHIFRASSLQISDPEKHWICVTGDDIHDPRLKNKMVRVDVFAELIREFLLGNKQPLFMYAPDDSLFRLDHSNEMSILERKTLRGGLSEIEITGLRRRALSAERHLLEMLNTRPDEIQKILTQLDGVVSSICSDALTEASANPEPYGQIMYRLVVQRLRKIVESCPGEVYQQGHDCLVGVTGILTNECKVWWSSQFDINAKEEEI